MSHRTHAPVGGSYWTRGTTILFLVAAIGIALIVWRFAVGLGAATGLNDGYPWGIWIAFDVVTGTALACGGYAVAFLVYILNKGRYHPLVRPALLTSALGYSIAAVAIVIDVGRPWFIWRIPVSVGKWNLDSALLEVALCVMAYVAVLWIELSPAFLEKMEKSGRGGWAGIGRTLNRFMDKALLVFIALGMLLPTMHQSSLGSVIMLAGPRLHALWHTAWLPLLFLASCIAMGYAVVVMESTISARVFGRVREDAMLRSLGGPIAFVLAVFLVVRFADIIVAGEAGLLFSSGLLSVLFWLETALCAVPMVVLATRRASLSPGCLFRQAFFIVLAGSLYRFDAYLVAYRPTEGWSYFPSVPETVMTVGLVSLEVLAFVWLVKYFPILSGTRAVADET
jgi:Ni/Fe-hydrogenase subunit HybB-like protein